MHPTHGSMKKQIDLFGNEISIEHATEKPVIKDTKEKPKKLAETACIPNRPYIVDKEGKDLTWIINK
jgi:hypothetical protein